MIVTAGSTNVSVYYYIVQDASATSPGEPVTGLLFSDIETGGSASYVRQGAARVDLTLITLASASAAHADGGFILVDDTNMPGLYRCDYPDAAFATGVDQTFCQIVVASANNAVAAPILIDITDVDLRDSVRAGLTALPNAAADAAGGLPISDAGGLDLDDIPLNAELNARTLVAANYFDPAADTVANVTTVATTTTNTDMRGTDSAALATVCTETRLAELDAGNLPADNAAISAQISALNDVAATDIVSAGAITTLAGAVGNVDLVDTCTTNTDQRGTDSALLAASINLTAGAVDNVTLVATTTTNTDMRGTDGANTVVPDAAGVAPTATEITADMDTNSTQLAAIVLDTGTSLPALIDDLAIKKNTTFSNFEFLMVLTSDGRTPATGLTVTGQRSIDGAAFTAVTGTIAEVSNGIYQFDAVAADTNGDVITWRFISGTADDTFVTFKTVA